ncbi:MAG: class I SAM-dependent methyltransferase [Acetobacteraceae bacterium]|nr:class I SAM-dependent methyltransferase [Acetobacteraceae bacterium]
MPEHFDADWLALREPHDAAARSRALAHTLARALPPRPALIDLGAGTGSLFRWLAPILRGPQRWTLADADPALLARAFTAIAAWAAARGLATTISGDALLVHTTQGAWRVEAEIVDLAAPLAGLRLNRHDAVVCSALLDLVSADWLARLAATLKKPLLACLSVDGRDVLRPAHPLDRTVFAGFRRDQQRAKGLGVALGPHAPAALHAAFTARGFTLRSAASDWRISPISADMLDMLVASHAEVAACRIPDRRAAIRTWAALRARQIDRGRLAMRIGHRDSLALPPGTAWPEET